MGVSSKAIKGILESTGAIVEEHYRSHSGICYQRHVNLGEVLECPSHVERMVENLADYFCSKDVTRVVSWTKNGALGAYSLAQQLGSYLTCTTFVDGALHIDEGYTLTESDRILLMDCHLEDDREVELVKAFVDARGCEIVGVACLIDMRSFPCDAPGLDYESVYQLAADGVKSEDCPVCSNSKP